MSGRNLNRRVTQIRVVDIDDMTCTRVGRGARKAAEVRKYQYTLATTFVCAAPISECKISCDSHNSTFIVEDGQ
jgi:tRNA U38,U39,U40 pseudouridine synthase TruA